MEPRVSDAQIALASAHELRGDYDKAMDRYRRVLAVDPQNVVALNNLAYALAERKHAPKEALPLAEKHSLLPRVRSRLTRSRGPTTAGRRPVGGAAARAGGRGAQDNPEILLHAAIVHAALNDKKRDELDAAELDPQLAAQPVAKACGADQIA
jgi:tetratricopeptide (TPR) repeat protein